MYIIIVKAVSLLKFADNADSNVQVSFIYNNIQTTSHQGRGAPAHSPGRASRAPATAGRGECLCDRTAMTLCRPIAIPLKVDTRQTYFSQFASGDGVVIRSEGPKRARRGFPAVQHIQVLFVSHPFLDVVLRHAFCLREFVSRIIGSWRPERVHFRPESRNVDRMSAMSAWRSCVLTQKMKLSASVKQSRRSSL